MTPMGSASLLLPSARPQARARPAPGGQPRHGGDGGVGGGDAYGGGSALVARGAAVALAELDGEAHVEVAALRDAGEVDGRVHYLDVGLDLDVRGGDLAGAVLLDLELYGLLPRKIVLETPDVAS